MTVYIFPLLNKASKNDYLSRFSGRNPDNIIHQVSGILKVSEEDLKGFCRNRKFVEARQISMYFIKMLCDLSLTKIGLLIGRRDHATVIYSIKTVNDIMATNKDFRAKVENIQTVILN